MSVVCTKDEMGRACRAQGGDKNAYKILVGKPEGKRRLGRRRHLLHLKFMESTVVYRLQFYSAVTRSRGSSGGIVSDYKLDGRSLIPGGGKGFFL
jgi:hypothetical protein